MAELLEEKIHIISDDYALGSDNYNIILYEKYSKMDGKGRNANPTGEVGWRPAKNGAYYGSIENLARSLRIKAELEVVGEVGLDFDKFTTYLDKWQKEIFEHLNSNITLELAKVKGKTVEEE